MVTLHGDADSVEKQIFALNPSLAENFVPTNRFMSKTPDDFNASEVSATEGSAYFYTSPRGDANGMAARDDVNGAKKLSDGFNPIDWYCATFATGDGKSNLTTALRSFSPLLWTVLMSKTFNSFRGIRRRRQGRFSREPGPHLCHVVNRRRDGREAQLPASCMRREH